MIYKKDIINFIFVASFPLYGLGCYIARAMSPSRGIIFNLLPFLAIVIFYLIDLLYKRDFQVKIKGGVYWTMMAYISSVIVAIWVAFYKGIPLVTLSTATGSTLLYLVIFHAFIIVYLYNGDKSHEVVPRLTLISLAILLVINAIGYYGLGMSKGETYYEGVRDDLPFFHGPYEAGTMAAMMCPIVVWLIARNGKSPGKVAGLVCFLLFLFFILIRVNSRISILVMMLTVGLFAIRSAKSHFVYWISLFTLPLVLNSRFLLYKILSLPVLAPIMVRTDFDDIVTLNGRTVLWERGIDWLLYDQRGLFFGNGLMGQYFISLLRDIQLVWHPETPHIMHFHSATMEIVVDQGLVGLLLLLIVLYQLFVFYRQEYINKSPNGVLFIAVVFLLFNAQIDTFILFGSTGTVVLFLLVAAATIKKNQTERNKVGKLSTLEPAHA